MGNLLGTLRRFSVLNDLGDAELEILARITTPVSLARGEYLFREGDPGDAVYLLAEGVMVAERLVDPAAGTIKELAVLPAPCLVGEMALAANEPRSASVRSEIASHTYRISCGQFTALQTASPTVALKLFRVLFAQATRRLRATNDELIVLYEVARFVASSGEASIIAEAVLRTLLSRLAATYALVAAYDPAANGLRITHAAGAKTDHLLGTTIALSGGLAARAYDERRSVLVEQLLGATEPWESRSMLIAPLVTQDRSRGILVLGAPEGQRSYVPSQLPLVTAVANVSSRVLMDAYPS